MKAMDYAITGQGSERTITPRTERGKGRTPEPITFKDSASALEFVNAAAAEGFRFAGLELVDPQKKLVKYGYYVRVPTGDLVFAGQDWGPSEPVFEAGDSLGIKNGKEGVILDLFDGKIAELIGVGVMCVVEERDIKSTEPSPVERVSPCSTRPAHLFPGTSHPGVDPRPRHDMDVPRFTANAPPGGDPQIDNMEYKGITSSNSKPFQLVQILHDPTPGAIVLNRILRSLFEISTQTDLTEEERGLFIRILLVLSRKMISVWNHLDRYKREEEKLINEARNKHLMESQQVDIVLSQELFAEFDEYLVQLKSTLDHLVKIPVPIFGRNVWSLTTFGGKGDDVLKALKNNIPRKYRDVIIGFEKMVFENTARGWKVPLQSATERITIWTVVLLLRHSQFSGVRILLKSLGGRTRRLLEKSWKLDGQI